MYGQVRAVPCLPVLRTGTASATVPIGRPFCRRSRLAGLPAAPGACRGNGWGTDFICLYHCPAEGGSC